MSAVEENTVELRCYVGIWRQNYHLRYGQSTVFREISWEIFFSVKVFVNNKYSIKLQ
jgi:hypothetical protein